MKPKPRPACPHRASLPDIELRRLRARDCLEQLTSMLHRASYWQVGTAHTNRLLAENWRTRDPMEAPPLNIFADLVSPEDVRLDLEVSTKTQLLEEIGQHMERQHGLPRDWVTQSLTRREQAGSTGVGEGVAIPHARVKELDHIQAAYLRLKTPIPYAAPDGQPVRHIVVLLVPKQATEEHLRVLAAATQMFSDGRFRRQLERCGEPGEAKALIGAWSQDQ